MNLCVILELKIRQLPLSTALIYDAVMLLAQILRDLGSESLAVPYEQQIDCFNTQLQSNYKKGETIVNYIKAKYNSNFTGLSGLLEFDTEKGKRTNVAIDILNLDDEKGLKKTGLFQLVPTNNTMRLTFIPKPKEEASDAIEDQTFNVVISLVCVVYSTILKTTFSTVMPTFYLGFCLNFYFPI